MSEWKGVVPALITPLTDGGRKVDLDAFADYCSFMAGKGVQGVFCCGTTGEGPLLTLEERKSVAETAVPGFSLFIYNIPVYTGNNMSRALFERLLNGIDMLVGLKNSNDDMFQIIDLIRLSGKKCSIFNGNDGIILPSLACGAHGLVSGNASVFPEQFVEIYSAVTEGNLTRARELQQDIDLLRGVLACGRDNASFKKALEFRGIRAGDVRMPDQNLTEAEEKGLRASLKKICVI